MRRRWLCAMLLLATGCRHGHADPERTLERDGRQRTYRLHHPAHPAAGLLALVVALHGRLDTGAGQAKMDGLEAIADREGFLVAYPDGVSRSWADARGSSPASRAGVDDVGFLRALIERLVRNEHADPGRVFVVGLSNGAVMAQTLACRLGDTLTGIAAVEGYLPEPTAPQCRISGGLTVLLFGGTADSLMPYAGGDLSRGRGRILGARANALLWTKLDRCPAPSTHRDLPDRDPGDGTRTSVDTWSGCADGAEVRLYTVEGGGHTWPGGPQYLPKLIVGPVSRDFSASEEMWSAFAGHRR